MINAQKTFSLLTIFAAMTAGAIQSFAAPQTPAPRAALPSVASVLPDPLPLDTSSAVAAKPQIITTSAITIFGEARKAPGKVWKCGPFRPLATDETASVRTCEWM